MAQTWQYLQCTSEWFEWCSHVSWQIDIFFKRGNSLDNPAKTSGTQTILQVICLPAGPNVQRLHFSRCCAFALSFLYPPSIIQSMSFCLGLPLCLFPSILPSIISVCRELPLRMCPIQLFWLVLIISIKDLFSSTCFNTSSFVLCSVQLILCVLLNIHI